jgi:hypothetical protein
MINMPSTILSLAMVFGIALFAIFFVLGLGMPVLDTTKGSSDFRDAEISMRLLDNYLNEVAKEGNGSIRKAAHTYPKSFSVMKGEDAVVFYGGFYSTMFEPSTRTGKENLIYITGADVNCFEDDGNYDGLTDIIIENTYVRFVFNKTGQPENLSNIDTNYALLRMIQKTTNTTVAVVNSSVYIDENSATSYGRGYSELQSTGKSLPFCTVHFFVDSNSTIKYDIYYRLYAKADFLVADVRNIR